ncbi:MAG: RNA-guided endonuclease InsQ/TnpB family protein, partial [bacterium]
MNKTYIISVPQNQQLLAQKLSRWSGRIYSKVVSTLFKLKKKKDIWLSKNNMEKFIRLYAEEFGLQSQSQQGTVQQYYYNLKSFFKSRKDNEKAKPPFRRKKYFKVIYKKSAISLKEGYLILSNGRKGKPLRLKVPGLKIKPKYAELLYDYNQDKYKVHIVIEIENRQKTYDNDKKLSIDLGQIHPMTTFDGEKVKIYNGGKLNSFIRFGNKELGQLQQKMSRCQKYSKRWNLFNRAKKRMLKKSRNKIMDVLKKYTSILIGYCLSNKISTIIVGDIKGIREKDAINFNTKSSQKIHQWVYKLILNMIEYKAKSVGIKVELINESYTSQTCPKCNNINKTKNRNYRCSHCGFKYHRDG